MISGDAAVCMHMESFVKLTDDSMRVTKGDNNMFFLKKMPQRFLCLALACLFAFVTVPEFAAAGRDEILSTIYQYCETKLGYTREN